MQKTVLFLVNAKAGLPRLYRCLKDKPCLLLSYQKKTAETTVYAPNTTWASGRNRLIEYVKANRLLYDYYVFLDEDVMFPEMSQKAGFEMFLSALSSLDYPVVVPKYKVRVPRSHPDVADIPAAIFQWCPENPRWEFQTVDWFDGVFNAFSREAFFDGHLLPYEERFDARSWTTSPFVTLLRINHRYRNGIVQCNRIRVANLQHSGYPTGAVAFPEAYRLVLDQFGVDKIEMSTGEEIICGETGLKRRWCPKWPWLLRYRIVLALQWIQRFGHRVKNRILRQLKG